VLIICHEPGVSSLRFLMKCLTYRLPFPGMAIALGLISYTAVLVIFASCYLILGGHVTFHYHLWLIRVLAVLHSINFGCLKKVCKFRGKFLARFFSNCNQIVKRGIVSAILHDADVICGEFKS